MTKLQKFTDANFKTEVLSSDQPVLVDFWAAWCGPCRAVGPTIDELAEQFDGSVKDGEVVETLVGVQSKERYETALQNAARSAVASSVNQT